MSLNDSGHLTNYHPTAQDLVVAAVRILQRGLPPGDLDDRQVVMELWGLLDNKEARAAYRSAHGRSRTEN